MDSSFGAWPQGAEGDYTRARRVRREGQALNPKPLNPKTPKPLKP